MSGSLGDYEIIGPLAYQGKHGCQDARCTRRGFLQREDGTWEMGECMGWHCSYCDEPCSSQGHRCDASRVLLDEAERIHAERRAAAPGDNG